MVLGGLKERLGVGGPKTGLEQQANTIKYVVTVAGPFYIVWGAANVLDWLGYPDELIMMVLFVGMAMWGSGVYGWHSHQTKECAELNAFPQSKWRFDSSTKMAIDLFIPKGSVRFKGKIAGGNPDPDLPEKYLYVVGPFPQPIGYDHPDLGFIVFDRAYWILPDTWKGTFEFLPGGEVWWNGIPVNHPNTESVSLHVKGWEDHMGEMIPVCLVCDSTYHYKHGAALLRSGWDKTTEKEIDEAKSMVLGQSLLSAKLRLKTTEYHLDKTVDEDKHDDKIVDKRVGNFVVRHRDVMSDKPPLRYRLLNMKTFAYVMVAVAVVGGLVWLFWFR